MKKGGEIYIRCYNGVEMLDLYHRSVTIFKDGIDRVYEGSKILEIHFKSGASALYFIRDTDWETTMIGRRNCTQISGHKYEQYLNGFCWNNNYGKFIS